MTNQLLFVLLTALLLLGLFLLFVVKSGLQLQYLKLRKGQQPGSKWDYLKFNFSDKKARQLRLEAFLLFPMLYPIVLDEQKKELNELKKKIKKIHIGIYGFLILLIVLGIYSEKIIPSAD